jgi:hypothetical protein
VLAPVVRAAFDVAECVEMARRLGYGGTATGEREGRLAEYGAWLGKRYGPPLWGGAVSNGMAVMARVLLAKRE